MAGMCCRVNSGGETEASTPVEPSSKSARRRRMEIHYFNYAPTNSAVAPPLDGVKIKRRKTESSLVAPPKPREICTGEVVKESQRALDGDKLDAPETASKVCVGSESASGTEAAHVSAIECPKFGVTSVCGRRRDMEDAVAIHPSFCGGVSSGIHFFGVYDGHGCSHVATRCKERMHEIVRDEYENHGRESSSWEGTLSESFTKMDREVVAWTSNGGAVAYGVSRGSASKSACRCELQTPQCDAVGSTAVVAVVTPEKIIVSNCGDSRAVLCRNGVAVPLSQDHKPDRPDELNRIQEAGGRVIYWDGPRVLGVLAMSRAIGDNYLKPYVISEPEVTVTARTSGDECLILASDGLWDVVSNETACGVARMCIQSRKPPSPPRSPGSDVKVTETGESSDKACSDASILLTKLALARHSVDNVSVVVVDLRRTP